MPMRQALYQLAISPALFFKFNYFKYEIQNSLWDVSYKEEPDWKHLETQKGLYASETERMTSLFAFWGFFEQRE